MFRALVILASIVGAAAFAPASRMARSSLKMTYSNEAGVTAPAGFFDPLGLSKDIDAATFAKYRSSEIKHGRVCQLAVLGYVAPETYRFPFDIAPGVPCSSIPNGIAAIEAVPALGWMQMFFFIGAVDYALETTGKSIFAPTGAKEFASAEEELAMTNKEINNGRLAMLATLELLRHDAQGLVGGMYAGDAQMGNMITGLPFVYGN